MTRGRRRADWARLVEEQSSSGLRVAEWCRQKTINEKTFRRWKRNLTTKVLNATEATPAGWCQVQPKTKIEPAGCLKLVINNRVAIELQAGFDHQLLQEVLGILCP
jgi:hypothetical protein